MQPHLIALTILPLLTMLGACSTAETPATPRPQPAEATSTEAYMHWLGRWQGTEGTYLELSHHDRAFTVLIHDLDGAATYPGDAQADGIVFVRAGRFERLHSGDGKATGMKWLLDKRDCLVIRDGEGYCRD
ncbi:MAG: hypothetical protein Q7J43_14595 [Pseudomonas sp.]|uniref:hypothetical protein n=1 Tax=Pseudomonas sp. TaxID=306 RepID=UPI002728992B|nr:hypothetical protein [Pseudomonas sp.]MDO9618892.1 hypothetical protein [Pseudomonas sp.]MDP2444225.1 hypothetical protein [Pseudomonas sp.]MDZ4336059.1 hypothetical protein [Pseudomonas sp.]